MVYVHLSDCFKEDCSQRTPPRHQKKYIVPTPYPHIDALLPSRENCHSTRLLIYKYTYFAFRFDFESVSRLRQMKQTGELCVLILGGIS